MKRDQKRDQKQEKPGHRLSCWGLADGYRRGRGSERETGRGRVGGRGHDDELFQTNETQMRSHAAAF